MTRKHGKVTACVYSMARALNELRRTDGGEDTFQTLNHLSAWLSWRARAKSAELQGNHAEAREFMGYAGTAFDLAIEAAKRIDAKQDD